jgi:hypothetical protein
VASPKAVSAIAVIQQTPQGWRTSRWGMARRFLRSLIQALKNMTNSDLLRAWHGYQGRPPEVSGVERMQRMRVMEDCAEATADAIAFAKEVLRNPKAPMVYGLRSPNESCLWLAVPGRRYQPSDPGDVGTEDHSPLAAARSQRSFDRDRTPG